MTTIGSDLRIGDTISVWWKPGKDTITALEPYVGSLAYLWGGKARIASFATSRLQMTIEPHMQFEILHRMDIRPSRRPARTVVGLAATA